MALGGGITVPTGTAGELKRALNETGWLAEEVVAAGHFRQGKSPSMAAMQLSSRHELSRWAVERRLVE